MDNEKNIRGEIECICFFDDRRRGGIRERRGTC